MDAALLILSSYTLDDIHGKDCGGCRCDCSDCVSRKLTGVKWPPAVIGRGTRCLWVRGGAGPHFAMLRNSASAVLSATLCCILERQLIGPPLYMYR